MLAGGRMREITVALLSLLLTVSSLWGQTETDLDRRVRDGKDAIYRQEYAAGTKIYEDTSVRLEVE